MVPERAVRAFREGLEALVLRQHERILQCVQAVAEWPAEIARLKSQPPSAPASARPAWVQPKRAEQRSGPRKKRVVT